jgi:hypothetical protein
MSNAPASASPDPELRSSFGSLLVPAVASLAAGAIHAAAIGVHSEHAQAGLVFTLVAAFQIGWGALALVRPGRTLAVVGVVGHTAALGGWLLAKTTGIGFVEGMGAVEAVQLADGMAAALALVALAGTIVRLAGVRLPAAGPRLAGAGMAAIALLAFPGMVSAGSHNHAGGDEDHGAHGDEDRGAPGAHDDGDHGERAELAGLGGDDHHEAVEGTPYDPALPLNFGGMEGVTPEQQAAAENLVAVTLRYLPQFADPAAAEAAGYHSIGDGGTGYEHLINWDLIDDGRLLDPNYPEALVYAYDKGERTLEAAMFMMPSGTTLDDVPELGGELTQWHIHDDLCFSDDPTAPRVAGVTEIGGECPAPLVKFEPVPMIHVWIVPHECGPFSALEGIAGGQVAEGETHLCDEAHGHGGH